MEERKITMSRVLDDRLGIAGKYRAHLGTLAELRRHLLQVIASGRIFLF